MAVTNSWTGQAFPLAQLRPFCFVDVSAKKSIGPSCFVLDLGWTARYKPPVSAKRIRKNRNLCCRCSSSASSSLNWDWSRWSRHFSEIEQAESFASVLKFQLEDAIEKEDFEEAAKLKMAISEATYKDSVADILFQLKTAIEEERYHDASRLCRHTGSGLVGWWVGCSEDPDDPFGRLVQITPGMGRFVGRSYSPRQLVTASPGTPLFEIFVIKDADDTYVMQVVYLQRNKGSTTSSTSSESRFQKDPPTSEVNTASVSVQAKEVKAEKNEDKGINIEGATEEGIKSVINFLKDKIPGLKVNVMNVVTMDDLEDRKSVKQLMQEDDENTGSSDSSEDETDNLEEIQPDEIAVKGGGDSTKEEKDLDMKLFIGGIVHNKEDAPSTKDDHARHPAAIKDMERDSFVLHVPQKSLDHDIGDSKTTKVQVAAIAAEGVSELMPSEIAKVFFSADKVSPKVRRDVREIVKLAVSQAQKQNRLSEHTRFNRIKISNSSLDPFDGLYVGAFGPYGTEVVQLRRKFGHWNGANDESSDVEFFEYVEAVKLTGDLNVPAGEVTFRAKIGKASRSSNRGMYPDELGVVASYKGQGRIAEFGFKNPKWVDGELLQLSGKGMGPYVKGADLGFLYVIPDQSFLVLFNRLRLPN